MKKKASQILIEHFSDHFGKLIAELLFKQKLHMHGIRDFDEFEQKDPSEQIAFGEKVINEIFEQFYPPEKIQSMRILYLLRFSLNEATGRIETMINKNSDLQIGQLSAVDLFGTDQITEDLNDNETVKFVFETSNLVEGVLMFSINKDEAIKFAMLLIEVMQGEKIRDFELDDMKISAINEFFNILLPSFVEVISNVFNEEIFYFPIPYDDFTSKYYPEKQLFKPEKILTTKIQMNIDKLQTSGNLTFFIKQLKGSVSNLVSMGAKSETDIWEKDPPEVFVKRTKDVNYDVRKILTDLKLNEANIKTLLGMIDKPDFSNFNRNDFNRLYDELVDNYMKESSEKKKANIKVNLAYLFGL